MTITPDTNQLDALFMALSHSKRRAMVHLLSLHPATVKQLAGAYDLSLPAMHKHIRLLEQAQLIARKKVGRVNFVALNGSSLKLVQDWAMQYRTDWGNSEQTLENYIASLST